MGPPGQTWINEVNIGTREVRRIVSAIGGGDFHAWTPTGVLLMAQGSRIFQWDPEAMLEPEVDRVELRPQFVDGWRLIADLEDMEMTISRLAVSPDGSKIAIVGEPVPQ